MGASNTYLTGVLAAPMTAGIGAANIVAIPEAAAPPQSAVSNAELAAITIPIVDIDQTVGPLTFTRLLQLTLGTGANSIFGILDSSAGSSWEFPLLNTFFTNVSSGQQIFSATRNPDSLDFGFTSSGPVESAFSIFGIANGTTSIDRGRQFGLSLLTGGAEGLGAALGGTLSQSSGVFGGQLSVIPFNGFKAVGNATLINGSGGSDLKLGNFSRRR
jgi:hypothetical protein